MEQSKKSIKKQTKKELKEIQNKDRKDKLEEQRKEQEEKFKLEIENDPLNIHYGELNGQLSNLISLSELTEDLLDQIVNIRARVQSVRSFGRSFLFLTLRHQCTSIQAVVSERENSISKPMIKYVQRISPESIVDIEATLSRTQQQLQQNRTLTPTTTATELKEFELIVNKIYVVSKSDVLPISFETLTSPGNFSYYQRMQNKILDLRVAANNSIFKLQSKMTSIIHRYAFSNEFTEIHTPKILDKSDKYNTFKLDYFGKTAYMTNSSLVHRQMAIASGFKRVYEVGPMFSNDRATTHRHLTEHTQIDLEMQINEHYHELLEIVDSVLVQLFKELADAPEHDIIKQLYPHDQLIFSYPTLIISYSEAINLLIENGETNIYDDELSTTHERQIGRIIRDLYGTDYFILDKVPSKYYFYKMADPNNQKYGNSFNIYVRGMQIGSGSQRIHSLDDLKKSINNLQQLCGINHNDSMNDHYFDCFKYGISPHAGCSIGLERLLMNYLNLNNIRSASMFPKDSHSIYW